MRACFADDRGFHCGSHALERKLRLSNAMVPARFDQPDSHLLVRSLIATPELDEQVSWSSEGARSLRMRFVELGQQAWLRDDETADSEVRLMAQRCLYALNRLRLYWADDPRRYVNEHSPLLTELRASLEEPWERWLERRVPPAALEVDDAAESVRGWAARDRVPRASAEGQWLAESMQLPGYRRLLEIFSLNGLVEASQLCRALGGAPTPVQAILSRVFIEEYGAGRLARKHSTYFAQMLEAQGMSTAPEAYFEQVPWQVLGAINHLFFLTENKRQYIRFCGAFTYTETSTPAGFCHYARAAERLGLSNGRDDYWALHVREDARHGAWMFEGVALPLLAQFPHHQRDLLLGYLQQREVESLAARATFYACQAAERSPS